jgi:hypothetical protein
MRQLAGIRSPFQRGMPCPPDLFTVTMATTGCTLPEAVARLAHAAGLLAAEPACEHEAEA